MALFQISFCCCIDIGFRSKTFVGMHRFHWNKRQNDCLWKQRTHYGLEVRSIIIKYKSSSILVIMAKFWPCCSAVST